MTDPTPQPPPNPDAAPPAPWTTEQPTQAAPPAATPPPWAGQPYSGYTPTQQVQRPGSGLAITALILGIVGSLFGLIPLTFWIAGTLGVIGLVLGLVAVGRARRARAPKKLALAGTILSTLAVVLAIVGAVIFFGALDQLGDNLDNIDQSISADVGQNGLGTPTRYRRPTPPRKRPARRRRRAPPLRSATISVGDDDGTIDADIRVVSAKTYTRGRGEFADTPKQGRFLVVEVLVTVKAGTLSYNPFDWSYQHPNGTTYRYGEGNAIFAGFEPQFQSGELTAGQKTRGLITIDVKYAKGGIVQYSPGDTAIAAWTV